MQTPLAIQPHAWFGRWERVLKERKGRSRERKEERKSRQGKYKKGKKMGGPSRYISKLVPVSMWPVNLAYFTDCPLLVVSLGVNQLT